MRLTHNQILKMRLTHYIYIIPLALLTACSSEDDPNNGANHSLGGQIELSAGLVEGTLQAETRAAGETYQTLKPNTAIALQVSGTWTGHTPENIVKTSIAEVEVSTSTANDLELSPALYWDDYGMADPANASSGRTQGLTIYGVAVDGEKIAPTVTDWTALSWDVKADQTAGWTHNDLLISNNIKEGTTDGTYLFDERTAGKQLAFRHAMSKITVNLKAGDGFTGGEFVANPVVELTSNEAGATINDEWAYTKGTVNVTNGVVTLVDKAVITMYQASAATSGYNVTKEALVMPGSEFKADDAIIARVQADGNIYYVTGEKIRTAINATSHATDGAYILEAGKNYIINVTVNKTSISVTATIVNWTDITAEEVSPVINVWADFGNSSSSYGDDAFSFYRSNSLDDGYSNDSSLVENGFYKEESVVSKSGTDWTMTPRLFWAHHNIHYQFRGVLPRTTTDPDNLTAPHVETAIHNAKNYQVIKVQNVAYAAGSFPSDLQIARPEIDEDATCTNDEPGHTRTNLFNGGICATEGNVNLNFRYMMAQVEVHLSTTNTSSQVNLENAVVEIVNVYNTGDVKLGDREVIPTGSLSSYTLATVSGAGNENMRLSAIVPQQLTYTAAQASTNVRFRITLANGDVYYADVAPIKKTGTAVLVAPNGKWESGVHYVYHLKLSKTEITVSATLDDWSTVKAEEDVWF
ncbi:fimbrillin family protein [Prevotella sp. E9-3]|uniref:fimbrillin family protein n=1 Tax=Prevotella sp. E9-3 TaxID=2913621 RepID=UPI001EDA6FEC|nr:fimbrillin family protein [Prevotella sp. E9-3]UKK48724.1 fimbrillin family protein [Prevotella sp. E9-3]